MIRRTFFTAVAALLASSSKLLQAKELTSGSVLTLPKGATYSPPEYDDVIWMSPQRAIFVKTISKSRIEEIDDAGNDIIVLHSTYKNVETNKTVEHVSTYLNGKCVSIQVYEYIYK